MDRAYASPTAVGAGYQLAAARVALRAVGTGTGCPCSVVELHIDGLRFAVELELDRREHLRRQGLGLGAVTDTGLLHALWELPRGLPIPLSALDDRDIETLTESGAGHVDTLGALTRTYAPAGHVTSVVVVANHMETAARRVSRLPRIFQRLAVALRSPSRSLDGTEADEGPIGRVVAAADGALVVMRPAAPAVGVPAVYRWWLAELAYRNWAGENCAHCMI